MQLKHKNDCVEIFIDTEEKLLLQVWKKEFPSHKDFKDGIDVTVELFKNHQLNKLISDTRSQPSADKVNTDYAASVMHILIGYGLRKMAFIVPPRPELLESIQNFTTASGVAIIRNFDSIEEANLWLENKEPN